jgi:hypothetical protein
MTRVEQRRQPITRDRQWLCTGQQTGKRTRPCENVREPTSWRIGFSVALFPIAATRYSSSDWRNQEGFSTRILNASVFAQAGTIADFDEKIAAVMNHDPLPLCDAR